MRIAVVQHVIASDPVEDALAASAGAREAVAAGAEYTVFPALIPSDHAPAREVFQAEVAGLVGVRTVPHVATGVLAQVDRETVEVVARSGAVLDVVLLHGDACMDGDVLASLSEMRPHVLVLTPGAESELQAEAVLELAIALSESVAPLVIIAEAAGAGVADPGHGGSAIVLLGAVLAEADSESAAVLLADIPEPLLPPDPPEPLPQVPAILAQRVAHHQGRRPEPGYPADLSGGYTAS